MTAAAYLILRYRRVILAVGVLLVLLLAQCQAKQDEQACAPTAPTISASGLAYPIDPDIPISSGFGARDGGEHNGVDFAAPLGSPVYALADGTVTAAQDQGVGGFGGWVVLSHVIDGKPASTVYGHMDPGGVKVAVGQQVRAGDTIAVSGKSGQSSGPHLHFELHDSPDRIQSYAPIDPTSLLERIRSGDTTSPGPADEQAAAVAPTDSVVDANASAIIAAGQADGVPGEAIVRGLATGLVETEMRNLASEAVPESKQYPNDGVAVGDHASIGILQQQVGMGYGTVAEMMQVQHQAQRFFRELLASDWAAKSFTESVADVQRPREDLRGKYGAREAEARALFERLAGHAAANSTGKGGCAPKKPSPGGGKPGNGSGAAIVAAARSKIGTPYVWGGGDIHGATMGGFDCSGLTMYAVYTATGKELPHYTGDQVQIGQPVGDIAEAEPGDLVYFNGLSDPQHVGIYTETRGDVAWMVHAPTEGLDVVDAPVTDGGTISAIRRHTGDTPSTTSPAAANSLLGAHQ
ncbi:peptidoglycan DD-metalloendopeptidase family protein [Nocardia sp. NPDC048505]|uniref:peptidoglycan DD-metalloendopeptidase family protein n=1 Tax=Nocardia sp. NPDC048505 TaxID=3155756 RepID=UPI0034065A05